jgi:hypothetical protein
MGVCLSLRRIGASELAERIAADERHAKRWLGLGRFMVPTKTLYWAAESATSDIDKAWQGIHFLLTGTADGGNEPECLLLIGGHRLRSVDLGYGDEIPRGLVPDQVMRFAACLAPLTREMLKERYDTKRMIALGVYLATTFDRDGEMGFEYLFENFTALRRFVTEASTAGDGLVIYLG